jgi:hypothetical protein
MIRSTARVVLYCITAVLEFLMMVLLVPFGILFLLSTALNEWRVNIAEGLSSRSPLERSERGRREEVTSDNDYSNEE